MAETIRVTDETTRADLVIAIGGVCDRAKRIPQIVGSTKLPTEWDRRHEQINDLLADWEKAPV
jgi:hypothetical protein